MSADSTYDWKILVLPKEADSEECNLLAHLDQIEDKTLGSDDWLRLLYSSWFPRVSPQAVNFLRPFSGWLRGRAFELGAGTGVHARFLAETGCDVDAFEPDGVLSRIAQKLCADLPSASVSRDFRPDGPYDVVLASRLPDLANRDLQAIALRDLVGSDGTVIVPFRNALANGVPRPPIATQQEIESALARAGFSFIESWAALPDLPAVKLIVSPEFDDSTHSGFFSVITDSMTPLLGRQYWRRALENHLFRQLCPAGVIVARQREDGENRADRLLAISYATLRRKHFAKETRFIETPDGLIIKRRRLFQTQPTDQPLCTLELADEPFIQGDTFAESLVDILSIPGWTPGAVAGWSRGWVDWLHAQSYNVDEPFLGAGVSPRVLPPHFLDAVPANAKRRTDGSFQLFDLEYRAAAPVPLNYVVFRGLFQTIQATLPVAALPAANTSGRAVPLAIAVMRELGFDLPPLALMGFRELETEFQHFVTGIERTRILTELGEDSGNDPSPTFSVLPDTLPSVTVQLFWVSNEAEYSETNCASTSVRVQAERQSVVLPVPELATAPARLRLDPTNSPGLVYILTLRVVDTQGIPLWEWDGDRAAFRDSLLNAVVFADPPLGGRGVLALAQSDDPWFELPIPRPALENLRAGGFCEVELAWPASPEYLALSHLIGTSRDERLAARTRELATARNLLDSVRTDLSESRSALTRYAGVVESLTAQLESARKAATAAEGRSLEIELSFRETLAVKASELSSAEQAAASANIKLAESQATVAKYSTELNAARETVETYRAKLAEVEAGLRDVTTTFETAHQQRSRLEGAKSQLEIELRDARVHIERLARQMAELESDRQRLVSTARLWNEESQALHEAVATFRRTNNDLTNERDALATANRDLSLENQRMKRTNNDLINERDALATAHRDLSLENQRMVQNIERLRKQIASLEEAMARIDAQTRDLSNRQAHTERAISGIYTSRIWQTLVRLGSPFSRSS